MDPRQVSFVYGRAAALPTWWTAYPAIAPQLTGWAGGPPAARLVNQPEHVIVDHALDALADVLGLPRGRIEGALVGTHTHNWHADPFARGAYSYVTVNGMDAVRALAAPVEHTLFFAGEATNTDGHTGTVHGAIATGRRAAREIPVGIGDERKLRQGSWALYNLLVTGRRSQVTGGVIVRQECDMRLATDGKAEMCF